MRLERQTFADLLPDLPGVPLADRSGIAAGPECIRELPVGQPVYVLGYLGERQGQPVIQRHTSDTSKKFLISYRSEQALTRANRLRAAVFYFVAGISGSAGVLLIAWRLLILRGR